MKCCIVGAGKHASENLIPALVKLQNEKLIELSYLCRQHVEKGDNGLGIKVVTEFPLDVDFMVVSGHPDLHKKAIDFSNKFNIPIFVEKPHLINHQYVNPNVMIGYNFNFISDLPASIDSISCGTKGIYKSWPDTFTDKYEKYYHAFQGIIIHPISIIIQHHGPPKNIIVKNNSKNNDVVLKIKMLYEDGIKNIFYSSTCDEFYLDVSNKNKIIKCKQFKSSSYYNMLKYYVETKFCPSINNAFVGEHVLFVINTCIDIIKQSETH